MGKNLRISNSMTDVPNVVQNDISTLQKWGDRVEDDLEEQVTPDPNSLRDGEGFEVVMKKSQMKKLRQKHRKSSLNVIQTRGRAASKNIAQ